MGMAKNKEIDRLMKLAVANGWTVVSSNGGHLKWIPPVGRFFFSASTPSDYRAIKNIERDLKQRGLDTSKHKKKGK